MPAADVPPSATVGQELSVNALSPNGSFMLKSFPTGNPDWGTMAAIRLRIRTFALIRCRLYCT